MMSMDLQALTADLQSMLGDCCAGIDSAALEQILFASAEDLSIRKPTHKRGTLTLVTDQGDYAAPADMLRPLSIDWGTTERARNQPWDTAYPQRLPRLSALDVGGALMLQVSPPPSAAQIGNMGSAFDYTYAITHTLSDTASETTVPASQRGLLLLRALAEAMRHLAARGVNKPVTLGAAGDNRPKNGAPAALAEQFMREFVAGCMA